METYTLHIIMYVMYISGFLPFPLDEFFPALHCLLGMNWSAHLECIRLSVCSKENVPTIFFLYTMNRTGERVLVEIIK